MHRFGIQHCAQRTSFSVLIGSASIRAGCAMGRRIARKVKTSWIARTSRAERISFSARIEHAFRVIWCARDELSAQMAVMSSIAIVSLTMMGFCALPRIYFWFYNISAKAPRKCDPKTEFDCGEGMCIKNERVCDGKMDCPDGQDEPKDKCNLNECKIKNGGCQHTCVDTPAGFYCECRPG